MTRRNIEFSAEAYTEEGLPFDAVHCPSEFDARAIVRSILLRMPEVAYVDVAEKWEEPQSSARAMTDVPVIYRYIVRIWRDREEVLTTVDGRAKVA